VLGTGQQVQQLAVNRVEVVITRHANLDPLCLDGDAGTIFADCPEITSERPETLIKRVDEFREQVTKRLLEC